MKKPRWFHHAAAALVAAALPLGPLACSAPGSDGGGTLAPVSTYDAAAASGPVAVPFTVSDDFQPTGFMGDSPDDFNAITMSSDASQCPARVSGAVGACYSIQWTPQISAGATSAWVGVYWQYPANNWGVLAGRAIQAGATKVTFAAAGAAGGEQVDFLVGGVNNPPSSPADAGLTHADSFRATKTVTLTKGWATYEVPLTGDTYESVIGGFAWSITASSTTPISFYVDDIQWGI
jgi:hypothetical protein